MSMLDILFLVFKSKESILFASRNGCKYFLYWKLMSDKTVHTMCYKIIQITATKLK